MSKQIMQFRLYNVTEKNGVITSDNRNQPNNISLANLQNGEIFTNYLPITQLGIQTLPGTRFRLNNATTPIIVGSTGIYELDLEGLSEITALAFERDSLDRINEAENAYLIIDAICEMA